MLTYVAAGWMDIFDSLLKMLGPVIGVVIGWLWGQWQANSAWTKRQFTNNLVLSLNMFKKYDVPEEGGPVGALKLRTLFERSLESLYPNKAMLQMVKDAGGETKPGDPILRFPEEDAWFILNNILNKIAEQFATGTLKDDMGMETHKRWYIFCLTFENDENLQQFKPRVLMMDKESFESFPETGTFDLESHHHTVRVDTIRQLKRDYKAHPYLFMSIQLSL